MTMVELVVAVSISVAVLAVAAGVFFSSLTAGRVVQGQSAAASQAQVAVDTITDRVSNGSDAQLSGGPAPGDQLLVVRSASTGAALTWHCHAWFYRAADGALLASDRPTGAPFIAAPASAAAPGWATLATSLEPRFARGIFELSGREVRVGFDLVAADGAVRIDTGAVPRNASATNEGASARCF